MKTPHLLAWHFTAKRNRLRDGSAFRIGRWTKYTGAIKLCHSGLHASIDPLDALAYAPGPWLWRVECRGEAIHSSGDGTPPKLVCSERKIIGGGDATPLLRSFARACATDVLHLWKAPQVVIDYLATGDESIRDAAEAAARNTAWDAAETAAEAAAWDAAETAAETAARAAVWSAARNTAWDAAWDTARDAAWAAVWSAARNTAWDAAWATAWDAAWDAQRARWNEMVNDWYEGGRKS